MRRSEQVAQDLTGVIGEIPTLSCAGLRRSWRVRPAPILRTAARAVALLVRGVVSLRGFARYLSYGSNIAQFLADHKPDLVALELCPGVSMIAGDIVRRSGIPYVVFPQNLEFLVPSIRPEATFGSFAGAYEIEASIYRHARRVLAISGFDATILKCMGIDAALWPSYPPPEERRRLFGIREARQQRPARRKEVLVLGTAINPPTRAGMNALLRAVQQSKTWMHPINVVGFGTQTLDPVDARAINIVGPVDDDRLDSLLVDCAFALVQQPPTTGFLTRLLDLNLAGVPVAVVGGYEQARGLQSFGIFFFDRLDDVDPDHVADASPLPFSPPLLDTLLDTLLRAGSGTGRESRTSS